MNTLEYIILDIHFITLPFDLFKLVLKSIGIKKIVLRVTYDNLKINYRNLKSLK